MIIYNKSGCVKDTIAWCSWKWYNIEILKYLRLQRQHSDKLNQNLLSFGNHPRLANWKKIKKNIPICMPVCPCFLEKRTLLLKSPLALLGDFCKLVNIFVYILMWIVKITEVYGIWYLDLFNKNLKCMPLIYKDPVYYCKYLYVFGLLKHMCIRMFCCDHFLWLVVYFLDTKSECRKLISQFVPSCLCIIGIWKYLSDQCSTFMNGCMN